MKILLAILAIMLTAFFTGCPFVKVSDERNPEADFSKMHAYALAPMTKEGNIKKPVAELIEKVITQYLNQKGYTWTSNGPDFIVNGRVILQEIRVDVRGNSFFSGDAGGIIGYDEGELILDFTDARTNELIYRTTGNLVIDHAQWTPEHVEETINTAVQKMLKKIPPAPAK